jgi:hypothetical protein
MPEACLDNIVSCSSEESIGGLFVLLSQRRSRCMRLMSWI